MSDFRVLVTGSRDWQDEKAIRDKLFETFCIAPPDRHPVVVVHGDCPTGADAMARRWAEWAMARDAEEVGHEPHPADWRHCSRECNPAHRKWRRGKNGDETYCPTAGHRRNQSMVDAGADLVLAFHKGNSPGTADCVRRARAAGIRVEMVEG